MENNKFSQVTLFSETDDSGVILFANEAFCAVSKYTKEELIGRPHNIIRHPDMPKILFEKLWNTIKNGNIFKAIIKNRAKDGSPYWVEATIMPVQSGDLRGIKYIGVRHLINDHALAETLYAEQAKRLKIH